MASDFDEVPIDRKIQRTILALRNVTTHLSDVRSVMQKIKRPLTTSIDIDVRIALEKADSQLKKRLESFVGPIWGMLPDDVRDDCRKAGIE